MAPPNGYPRAYGINGQPIRERRGPYTRRPRRRGHPANMFIIYYLDMYRRHGGNIYRLARECGRRWRIMPQAEKDRYKRQYTARLTAQIEARVQASLQAQVNAGAAAAAALGDVGIVAPNLAAPGLSNAMNPANPLAANVNPVMSSAAPTPAANLNPNASNSANPPTVMNGNPGVSNVDNPPVANNSGVPNNGNPDNGNHSSQPSSAPAGSAPSQPQ